MVATGILDPAKSRYCTFLSNSHILSPLFFFSINDKLVIMKKIVSSNKTVNGERNEK